MRKSEITHILTNKMNTVDPILMFIGRINEDTGEFVKDTACMQPCDWRHVQHIVGNIYYAWDDGGEDDGILYLGEFKDA